MKITASFELLIPTTDYGNAKLVSSMEIDTEKDMSNFPNKTIHEAEQQLNERVIDQVLSMKEDLDKLPATAFVVNR